jgi:hypothetical protein
MEKQNGILLHILIKIMQKYVEIMNLIIQMILFQKDTNFALQIHLQKD